MQQKRPSPSSTSEKTRTLPDIARDSTAQTAAMLDRVGMSGIETVLRRRSSEGELFLVPAKADAFVNLDDPEARDALFTAIRDHHGEADLLELPLHINDPEFAEACARRLIDLIRQ